MNAQSLNDHLAAGGYVQVTTYMKSWIYGPKHAGWFFEDSHGNMRVKHGRSSVVLSYGNRLLVGIRTGRKQ